MSGLVQRCRACGAEIRVERRHAGRSVPCPRCLEGNDVPSNLDFLGSELAGGRERSKAAWLLPLSLFGGIACCVPLLAFNLWYASGMIQRAREEGREPEPVLLSTRHIALIFLGIDGLILLLTTGAWVLRRLL